MNLLIVSIVQWYIIESCASLASIRICQASAGTRRGMRAGRARDKKLFVESNWMLFQFMWKWHVQKIQCYKELVVQECSVILRWWRDHRLEFPALSDLARNPFCVIATSVASERVFNIAGYVVNSRWINLNSSSVKDNLFLNSAHKAKKEPFKFDWKVSLQCF